MNHDPGHTLWLTPAQQHVWRAYLVGTTLLMDRLDRDLRERHDLSMPEYEIMVRLSESGERRMRMSALADSVSHSRSRVTHTVNRMERAGLVSRRPCVSDGRGVEALLTDRGFAILQEASHTHVRGVKDFLISLCPTEDLTAVARLFDAVTDALVSDHPAFDIR